MLFIKLTKIHLSRWILVCFIIAYQSLTLWVWNPNRCPLRGHKLAELFSHLFSRVILYYTTFFSQLLIWYVMIRVISFSLRSIINITCKKCPIFIIIIFLKLNNFLFTLSVWIHFIWTYLLNILEKIRGKSPKNSSIFWNCGGRGVGKGLTKHCSHQLTNMES